jgi:hypothetical protein
VDLSRTITLVAGENNSGLRSRVADEMLLRALEPVGAHKCKALQSSPLRCFEAGRDGRHLNGMRAIKLEAAPRYHFKINNLQN